MFSKSFICANNDVCSMEKHVPAPMFRKSFELETLPKECEFTICGLGFYELYINGKQITKGALAPYIQNPDDILYYDVYDLRKYLRVGENVIGVMLGNGFFNCFGGKMWKLDQSPWKGPVRVAFSLMADGQLLFESDKTVKTSPSPILLDDLRIGVFYDARLEQDGWNNIGFDDSSWSESLPAEMPRGEICVCEAEPVKVYRKIKPVRIKHYDDFCFTCESNLAYEDPVERTRVKDTYMYDFGENNSGVCRLKIKGERGQTVKLHFGEMEVDGYFSLRSTIFIRSEETDFYFDYHQMEVYTLKGGEEEIFIPPFTFHGFRYVLVEGITKEQAKSDLLTYLVMSCDMEKRGSFECSDETINQLYKMAVRSDRSNFLYVPTDCPHREKNGWTGDMALSAEHMLLHMKAEKGIAEWLRNMRKTQREDGALPCIVPTTGWGFTWGNGPAWDSSCVYMPYYCYKQTGDKRIIEENYDMMLRYLRYAKTKRDERGLVEYGLGDWCQPYVENHLPYSPVVFTDSAIITDISRKAAHLFSQIGENESAKEMLVFADEMKSAVRKHLIDFSTMTVAGNCQTSQTLAIAFDLLEEEEKPAALERLLEFIKAEDGHLVTGILGARQIFHVLAEYGYIDLAHEMIVRPDSPSYGAWIEAGATALCESFPLPGKRRDSQNHHMWGDILSLFIQEYAGLRPNPNVTDADEYLIRPHFPSALNFARAEVDGTTVHWWREEEKIFMSVMVLPSKHGIIDLPEGYSFRGGSAQRDLCSGIFEISASSTRKNLFSKEVN